MVFSAYISTGQIMGWGNKAIEIRAAETGHLDGVFMHKKAQKLKFLCERNDKVSVWSMNSISSWMRIHTELEQITGFHTNSCLGCQDCAFGEILLFIPLNRFINQQLGGGGGCGCGCYSLLFYVKRYLIVYDICIHHFVIFRSFSRRCGQGRAARFTLWLSTNQD